MHTRNYSPNTYKNLEALGQCIPLPRHMLPVSWYYIGQICELNHHQSLIISSLADYQPTWKFHENPFGSFCIKLLTDRQINKWRLHILLGGGNKNHFMHLKRFAHSKKKLVPCGTDSWLLLSAFQAVVTLTLTLYRVIRHTVVHQSSTSTHQMSLKSEKLFGGWTNRRDRSKFKIMWHKNQDKYH